MLNRKQIVFNWRVLALVLALGATMAGTLFVSTHMGTELAIRHTPLVDAVMVAKLELYRFRIALDEYSEDGDNTQAMDAWSCLDKAEWSVRAMLDGGKSEEGYAIVPLEDNGLRAKIEHAIGDIGDLRNKAGAIMGNAAVMGTQDRQKLNRLLEHVIVETDAVERRLWDVINSHIRYHRILNWLLGFFCVALAFAIGVVLHRYEARKADYLAELESSRQELRESRERFRSLVETTSDWIWEVDKDGVFTYVSPNVRELLGYTPDELVGKTAMELMPGDEAQKACDTFGEALHKGEPIRQMLSTVMHRDGRPVVMEAGAMPFFSEDGGLAGYRGVNRDVSERIKSENELSRARKRLELLLSCNPAVVRCCETTGGFAATYVSENVMESFGYTTEEFTGEPDFWKERLHPEDEPRVIEGMKKLLGDGQHLQEYRFMHKDGAYRWVREYINLIRDEHDRPLEIVGYIIDIDEMKMLQKRKDEFYSMVSHDLKSPVSVIRGYADLIREGKVPEKDLKEIAGAIRASSGKVLRMVNDFLDISRLQEGRIELHKMPVDIGGLLRRAAREFSLTAGKKGLEIVVEAPEVLPMVELDETYVSRAVANLVENAVKYTRSGGRVTIRAGRATRNGAGFVAVTVADTGPGIPAEEQGDVFEMYYRSKKAAVKGSGLGLAIVKAVAEAHGGRVELASEEGRGSEFKLLLPTNGERSA